MSVISFDSDGAWDDEKHEGPAIHVPNNVKTVVVSEYPIE